MTLWIYLYLIDRVVEEEAEIVTDIEDNMINIHEDFNIDEEIKDDGNLTPVCSQKRKDAYFGSSIIQEKGNK